MKDIRIAITAMCKLIVRSNIWVFLITFVQESNDFPILDNLFQNHFLRGEIYDRIVQFNQKGACEAIQNEVDDAEIKFC